MIQLCAVLTKIPFCGHQNRLVIDMSLRSGASLCAVFTIFPSCRRKTSGNDGRARPALAPDVRSGPKVGLPRPCQQRVETVDRVAVDHAARA